MNNRPAPFTQFAFYVFWSMDRVPKEDEARCGALLAQRADARFLQRFFDPLYAKEGIGISIFDDEVISGTKALLSLTTAIRQARAETRLQPDQWTEFIGYAFDPASPVPKIDKAILETASRDRILTFLDSVETVVERALGSEGHVCFTGGW